MEKIKLFKTRLYNEWFAFTTTPIKGELSTDYYGDWMITYDWGNERHLFSEEEKEGQIITQDSEKKIFQYLEYNFNIKYWDEIENEIEIPNELFNQFQIIDLY